MRLFIGIELEDSLRARLARLSAELQRGMRGSFSLADNYHITLVFLGQQDPDDLPAIRRAMEAAAARPALQLTLGGVGSFRKGNRAIVWQGVRLSDELAGLQRELARRLKGEGIAFDDGPYTPHITLARQCELAPLPGPEGGVHARMHVGRMTLFESARVDGVLRYTPLYSAALAARP